MHKLLLVMGAAAGKQPRCIGLGEWRIQTVDTRHWATERCFNAPAGCIKQQMEWRELLAM